MYHLEIHVPKDTIAKVFMTGRSQAVRLPKAFRFSTDRVRIRTESCAVILEPIEQDWEWLKSAHELGPLDDDAVEGAAEAGPAQKRPGPDVFN